MLDTEAALTLRLSLTHTIPTLSSAAHPTQGYSLHSTTTTTTTAATISSRPRLAAALFTPTQPRQVLPRYTRYPYRRLTKVFKLGS